MSRVVCSKGGEERDHQDGYLVDGQTSFMGLSRNELWSGLPIERSSVGRSVNTPDFILCRAFSARTAVGHYFLGRLHDRG